MFRPPFIPQECGRRKIGGRCAKLLFQFRLEIRPSFVFNNLQRFLIAGVFRLEIPFPSIFVSSRPRITNLQAAEAAMLLVTRNGLLGRTFSFLLGIASKPIHRWAASSSTYAFTDSKAEALFEKR